MAPPPLEIFSNPKARACENCNRKKKKCNGSKPQCLLCNQTGLACVYPSFTLKPGPAPPFRLGISNYNYAFMWPDGRGGR
ncbi:hypothetical protein HDV63DRAFT_390629 [Trichoderma sp. SZMC 28014]